MFFPLASWFKIKQICSFYVITVFLSLRPLSPSWQLSSQPFGRPSPCPPLPTILERWAFIQSRSLHFSLICCCEVATKSSPPPQCFDRQGNDLVAASQQQHQLKEYKWPWLAIVLNRPTASHRPGKATTTATAAPPTSSLISLGKPFMSFRDLVGGTKGGSGPSWTERPRQFWTTT